jgi:hypothetical protein
MMKPAHLMTASDGALLDTRVGHTDTLRPNYERHHTVIHTVADLKATLRAGPYAWPGGYPLYFVTATGETLSFEGVRDWFAACVNDINDHSRDRIVGCAVNWEDMDMTCAITNARIPSAYGTID